MLKSQDGPHAIDSSLSILEGQADFLMRSLGSPLPNRKKRYQAEVLVPKKGYHFASKIEARDEIEALKAVLDGFEGMNVYRVVIDEVISGGHRFHIAKGPRIP